MSDPFSSTQPPKPTGPEKEICHINKGTLYQCEWKVFNAGKCVSAIGQGSTMKEAQQDATKNLLNGLEVENNLALQQPNQIKNHKLYEILNGYAEPVSKLQFISYHLKNLPGLPEYVEIGAEGPPHQRKFTTQVSFDGMVELGIGNNKKTSKQSAASKMLNNVYQKLGKEKNVVCETSTPDPVIKSLINDIQTEVKGNGHEVQTQTDPPTSDKESCDITTQTKNGKIDQIGPRYDSDSDSDCENSNLLGRNCNDSMNNECIKTEPESGEQIESDEDEEEEEKEMKGFDFDSLFNEQPSTSIFSEMPKYSRTGVVHEEKSQIFQDLLSKMSEEDRVVYVRQENEKFIKRKRFTDIDDIDIKKKPKMLNFVPGNVSHYNKSELNSTSTSASNSNSNANEMDDDIDQMVNMDKIKYGVGSQLMLKMGFTPGEGLGKNKQGIKVPIKPQSSFANTNYKNRPGKGQRGWIP